MNRHREKFELKYKQSYEILDTIGNAIYELELIKSDDTIYKCYRGRAHNDEQGYKTFEELASPKKEYAIYDNRMSVADTPMFYRGFDAKH